ncbi:TraM recognition domain-containing protein [Leifsonia sp. H3M29-4]|uniref:type IV secretory system conjugative DNA transfer family protein n=1 Tax=Salinibacterium metalliresistens TaxID=3031321 RepID=UPI0023D9B45D|nr:TraM recognition domain-containing protein [Salinibacterium metalliresistens]MDF1480338.1 TraM recognition domain-containing protein [Salinibacterium metalliresistens]
MSAPSRRSSLDSSAQTWLLLGLAAGAAAIAGSIVVAFRLGYGLAGMPLPAGNWGAVLRGLLSGTVAWPLQSWIVLASLLVVLAAVATVIVRLVRRGGHQRIDRAARYMGQGREILDVTRRGAAAKAARLGIEGSPGVLVGRTVAGGVDLMTSWEDVGVCIAGPRTGKTTSQVIPAIADAPGAVVTTSNKRDVVDATRALRAKVGQVWVFDPQGIVDEPATWWWNPLSFVTNEVKAAQLAKLLSDASRDRSSRRDAFFDGSAETLLAGFLLAAALERRPFGQVYMWLTDVNDDEPAYLLAKHGQEKPSASVRQIVSAPEKQKGGIYGTAQQIMAFMINDEAMRWVEPAELGSRPEFSPAEFVRSTGTLYSLSKEGGGSTGPLVTALTVAVTEAAEDYAKTQPGGRLARPMLLVLDEAANICRWNNLPDLYSHYGSRGISIITILQSWSQGVEVWGRDGMQKLWTAANAKLYLGGVDEEQFLAALSQLVGEFEVSARSTSRSSQGVTNSFQARRERILDVSDLRAMPRGRALLLYSGTPAILVRTVPWMNGPHAGAIRAAIAGATSPALERTALPA